MWFSLVLNRKWFFEISVRQSFANPHLRASDAGRLHNVRSAWVCAYFARVTITLSVLTSEFIFCFSMPFLYIFIGNDFYLI